MFPLFPLLSKVIQKLRTTQEGEVINSSLVASQLQFPHLLRLCVEHPLFFPYRRDLLSQQGYVSDASRTVCVVGGSHAALPSSRIFEEVSRLVAAPRTNRPLTNRVYDDRWLCFAHWAAGQGIDPLGPTAAEIVVFLYYLFDNQGLSPQPIKGYRSCVASVLSHTGMAAAVQAKTMSDMITSMQLQTRVTVRMTPVLPQWDLDIILEALSKPPYVPLREASHKHLTLKTVFLLAMASAGRHSELQALVFDPHYIQIKHKGAGVTIYFPLSLCMTECPELRKGRRCLFIQDTRRRGRSSVQPLFLVGSTPL